MLPLKYKNKLYKRRNFWLTKQWVSRRVGFNFWKSIFGFSFFCKNERDSFWLLLSTLKEFTITAVYVIIVIFILEACHIIYPVESHYLANIFDDDAIDTFLAAVASISGVFLGLYFTAISSIAGNFLIKASQDIRNYFLRSPEGMQYVRTIALTGIISVFYLITKSLGHDIHPVGLIGLALLAAYIIIRFWSVGSSVFHALEPERSFPWITGKIFQSMQKVTPPGFQWHRDYIQNHQHKLAVSNMELLRNLINFGVNQMKIPGEQLVIAIKYLGSLMYVYADHKGRIPTESFWYRRRNKFQDWLLANSTQVDIALKTGTSVAPEVIKDEIWLERDILDIIRDAFDQLTKEQDFSSVLQGFEVFIDVGTKYTKNLDTNALNILFQELEKGISDLQSIKINDTKSYKFKEQLALTESQGRLAVAISLSLTKYLEENTADKLRRSIDGIDWADSKGDIYESNLPQSILHHVEELAKKLRNEILVEGKIVSPKWYIRTLCVQQYLFALEKYFEYIKGFHVNYFTKQFEELLRQEQFILAVHFVQRWREFANKYKHLVTTLEKHIEECGKYKEIHDLPWIKIDFAEIKKEAYKREKEIEDRLINLLPKLQNFSSDGDLPDYFGEALTVGLQACYSACEENDTDRLKKVFLDVFNASLSAHKIALKKVQEWRQEESKIAFSTEPIANLLDVSGYAKLFSSLYDNSEIWNTTKVVWDTYLKPETAKETIELLALITKMRAAIFGLMPQATMRAEWQIRFNSRMHDQGLPVWPEQRSSIHGREKVNHASALIRVVTKWGGLNTISGQDVFIATYLGQHESATEIEFPDNHDLKTQIKEEEETDNTDD